MSERHKRLESIIHRGAQSVINDGFADPRLEDVMITITAVSIDNDSTTAVLRVSVLPQERERRVIAGLTSAAKHIRRRTADRVNVHRMPAFMFSIDKGAKRQAAVLEALAKVRQENEASTDPQPQHTDEPTPETAPESATDPNAPLDTAQPPETTP